MVRDEVDIREGVPSFQSFVRFYSTYTSYTQVAIDVPPLCRIFYFVPTFMMGRNKLAVDFI